MPRKAHGTFGAVFCFLYATAAGSAQVSVVTNRYNNDRNAVNQSETILTTSNVSDSTFGKLFSLPVDGLVYAQPLYLPNLSIGGAGHNVVYTVTENNSVYAFDADNPSAQVLWHVRFGSPVGASGILSTPVIDVALGTIYVVAETYTNSVPSFYLHALNISTGVERPGSPVQISGAVVGTGDPEFPADAPNGRVTFNPSMEWQRPGLLELNGDIYVGFATHGGDQRPYHGWLFGYDSVSLRRTLIKCMTPNGTEGGIWQSGAGVAADANGNVYLSTGNGTFDVNSGGTDYGETVMKMNAVTGMVVTTYFTPEDFQSLNDADNDVGSVGTMLLPGESYAIAGCKDGRLFLMSTGGLGGYSGSADSVVQEWQTNAAQFGNPVFYNNQIYQWGRASNAIAYYFNGSVFGDGSSNPPPSIQGSDVIVNGYANEPALAISANGTTAGTAILWAAWSITADSGTMQGNISAYDASNLNRLWSSEDNHSRDDLGVWAKWSTPTIANGKVYVSSFGGVSVPGSYAIHVYGLLGH